MKKRIARIVVYFVLAGLTLLVLSHPYVRQSVLGPKIKGEPFWAWQEEFRAQVRVTTGIPTVWQKILSFLKLDSRPLQWIGVFPANDPELLPVLISLADDPDEYVRARVAVNLVNTADAVTGTATLERLLEDRSDKVQMAAIHSLLQLGPKSAQALPKMQSLLKTLDPTTRPDARLYLAFSILNISENDVDALRIVRDDLRSPVPTQRRMAVSQLTRRFHDDDGVFELILQYSANHLDPLTRLRSVLALHIFGKKTVPHLERLLNDADPNIQQNAISALGMIGSEAKSAAVVLRKLAGTPDPLVRAHATAALDAIEREQTKGNEK